MGTVSAAGAFLMLPPGEIALSGWKVVSAFARNYSPGVAIGFFVPD
jgi:hypothetical protein